MATSLVDSYQFGLIVVNGKEYASDVIIFPDRVINNWWRNTGHQLCIADIAEVMAEKPEVLVIGTGASGLMEVLPEVVQTVEAEGVELVVASTDKAYRTYNQLSKSRRAVAALHITC